MPVSLPGPELDANVAAVQTDSCLLVMPEPGARSRNDTVIITRTPINLVARLKRLVFATTSLQSG